MSNPRPHLEKLARIDGRHEAEQQCAATPELPRCACGSTWYDTTIYTVPVGWQEPQRFCCAACAPPELKALIGV